MKKSASSLIAVVVLLVCLSFSPNASAQINLGVGGGPSPFGSYGPYVTRPFGNSPNYSAFGPTYGSGFNNYNYPKYTVLPGSYPSLYYGSSYYRPPVELYGASTYPLASPSGYSSAASTYPYSAGGVLTNPTKSTYLYYPPSTDLIKNSKGKTTDIQVKVPVATAEVTFGGIKTKQQGTIREFVTPGLEAGKTFHYEIVARWPENDGVVEQKRKVSFKAGDKVVIDFTQAE